MNPQHFGSDPADIRINPTPDSNPELVEILALAEVCAIRAQSSIITVIVVIVVITSTKNAG